MIDLALVADPLFRLPFLTGLAVAAALPLIGVLLRLRDEWLAALGFAHLSAATGLAGLAMGLPVIPGAVAGAVSGAVVKARAGARGNSAFALMILVGWCMTFLIAANFTLGSAVGETLVEGQLLFAGPQHLVAAALLLLTVLLAYPFLQWRLIRARFFPLHERANRLPAWRWHLGFDLMTALGMAVGTAVVGLMPAFALVFVPAWIAFRVAAGWRSALVVSTLVGVFGYVGGFVIALALDQPFGPTLAAVLLAAAAAAGIARRPVSGDPGRA